MTDGSPAETLKLVGTRETGVRIGHARLMFAILGFAFCFVVLGGRLVELMAFYSYGEPGAERASSSHDPVAERADIVDRRGVLLATNLTTASLYADATEVPDAARATERLLTVLPGLDREAVLADLNSRKRYVYIKRQLTPREQDAVNRLGIPGLKFEREERRVYPHGPLVAHVLGRADIDGLGRHGVEKYFQDQLIDRTLGGGPLELSIDVRVQHAVHEELERARAEFKALGGTAIVMDANSGEVLSMVSLPDFDPNNPGELRESEDFNRAATGTYELGSVLKPFTLAMALEAGVVTVSDGYDATKPIRVARYTIRDDHPKKRWLSVPEILIYSSNIGAAKMALDIGAKAQLRYFDKFGMLSRPGIELHELGRPRIPARWGDINTMTAAYGHGIAISPLQLVAGFAALVNGGVLVRPTLLRQDEKFPVGERVVSPQTSDIMRRMLRLVVTEGTGRKADVPDLLVGGKTGTAEKVKENGRGYHEKALLSSFIAAFPMNDPKYVVYVLLDEPKGNKKTGGYATAGMTAAPTAGKVIERVATLLGVLPIDEGAPEIREAMALPLYSRESKIASNSAD